MRLEYWDTVTETAWICDPVSSCHEGPTHRLTELVRLIAGVRGAPVRCFGCTDLTERDEHGEPQLIMQADQSVYLHPARGIEVSADFPTTVPGFAKLPSDALVAAASSCVSEADFQRRLRGR